MTKGIERDKGRDYIPQEIAEKRHKRAKLNSNSSGTSSDVQDDCEVGGSSTHSHESGLELGLGLGSGTSSSSSSRMSNLPACVTILQGLNYERLHNTQSFHYVAVVYALHLW